MTTLYELKVSENENALENLEHFVKSVNTSKITSTLIKTSFTKRGELMVKVHDRDPGLRERLVVKVPKDEYISFHNWACGEYAKGTWDNLSNSADESVAIDELRAQLSTNVSENFESITIIRDESKFFAVLGTPYKNTLLTTIVVITRIY